MKDYLSKPEINFLLSILIPLIVFAISWGTMNQKVSHLEAMTVGLQSQFNDDNGEREELRIRIAEIQKDIAYIRDAIVEKKAQDKN